MFKHQELETFIIENSSVSNKKFLKIALNTLSRKKLLDDTNNIFEAKDYEIINKFSNQDELFHTFMYMSQEPMSFKHHIMKNILISAAI